MKTRIRVKYAKTEILRYTGNLDMHKIWERTLRRANIPLAYSQGFHPQPKINQACPLPLGMLSQSEYVDFWLTEEAEITISEITQKLLKTTQPGLEILNVEEIIEKQAALPNLIQSARYHVLFLDQISPVELELRIDDLMSKEQIIRTRRNKEYNLRPLIENLAPAQSNDPRVQQIQMQLSARTSATGRPDEVIAALGYDPHSTRITRTDLVFVDDQE